MSGPLKIDICQPHPEISMVRVSGALGGPACTVVAAALEELETMGIRTVIVNLGDPVGLPHDLLDFLEALGVRLDARGGELVVSGEAPDVAFEEIWVAQRPDLKPLAV